METKKIFIRIQKDVTPIIFDEPTLAKKVDSLFNGSEKKIKARVDEITKFLDLEDVCEIPYEDIVFNFKVYFFKLILNEAVERAFSGQEKYDILAIIYSLLSKEKIETAIMGKPMIDAFSKAIRSKATNNALTSCICGSKILLLEKEFLGESN